MKNALIVLAIVAGVVVLYVFVLKPLLAPAAKPQDPLGDAIGGVAGTAQGLITDVVDAHKWAFNTAISAPGAVAQGVTSVVGSAWHALSSLWGGGGGSTPYALPSAPLTADQVAAAARAQGTARPLGQVTAIPIAQPTITSALHSKLGWA